MNKIVSESQVFDEVHHRTQQVSEMHSDNMRLMIVGMNLAEEFVRDLSKIENLTDYQHVIQEIQLYFDFMDHKASSALPTVKDIDYNPEILIGGFNSRYDEIAHDVKQPLHRTLQDAVVRVTELMEERYPQDKTSFDHAKLIHSQCRLALLQSAALQLKALCAHPYVNVSRKMRAINAIFNNPYAKHGEGLLQSVLQRVDEFRPSSKFSTAALRQNVRRLKSQLAVETPQQLKDEIFSTLQENLHRDLSLSDIAEFKLSLQSLHERVEQAAQKSAQAEAIKKIKR